MSAHMGTASLVVEGQGYISVVLIMEAYCGNRERERQKRGREREIGGEKDRLCVCVCLT